jgi:hypothetical protein
MTIISSDNKHAENLLETQIEILIERILEGMEEISGGRIAERDWEKVHIDLPPHIMTLLEKYNWPEIHPDD